jgi:hypothetical protein
MFSNFLSKERRCWERLVVLQKSSQSRILFVFGWCDSWIVLVSDPRSYTNCHELIQNQFCS